MKTLFKNLIILASLSLSLLACKETKESKEGSVTPQSQNTLNAFLKNNEVKSQFFTINNDQDAIIKGKLNTEFLIPRNIFRTKDNKAISGNLTIELKEIFDKSDMILSSKPTVSNGQILISAGEFYINAKQNNQDLILKENSFITVTTPTQNIVKDMTVFIASDSINNGFNWITASSLSDPTNFTTNTNSNPFTYMYTISRLGWINCDAFYSNTGPKTNVTIDIGNKSPNSTVVYLVFKDINSVMGSYYYNSKFISTGQIPVGSKIEVVSISGIGSKFYLAHQEITVEENHNVNLQYSEASDDQIKTYMSTLNGI